MKLGIYQIPFEEYEAAEGISKHGLDALAISPLHYWAWYVNPERPKQKETPAKLLGSAIHTSILEPERFDKEYVREPDHEKYCEENKCFIMNTLDDYKKASKSYGLKVSGTKAELMQALKAHSGFVGAFWDEVYDNLVQGRKVLSEAEWRTVRAITARVRKHPSASELFKYGKAEQSIFWTDKETGVSCKGRLDWITESGAMIGDLKSTTDASPEGFQRSVSKYRYYVQAAMYVDGLKDLTGSDAPFIFAAWEKTMPYASALYYAAPEMLEAGRQEYKRLLKIYAECLSKDEWPGYSTEINPINLPENFKAEASSQSEPDWLDQMEQG